MTAVFDSPEIGEVRMTESRSKPERAWREIAEEVSKEYDSDKVAELSEELIKALDKQSLTIRAVQTEKVRQKST